MNKRNHSPAPWQLEGESLILDRNGAVICQVMPPPETGEETQEGNGSLIRSAPSLLLAGDVLLGMCDHLVRKAEEEGWDDRIAMLRDPVSAMRGAIMVAQGEA